MQFEVFLNCKTSFPGYLYHPDDTNINYDQIFHGAMKKPFILGVIGGFLGLVTALFLITSSSSNEIIFSGIQAALFSSLALMGAAISKKEPHFAGWMFLLSAVWITISVPVANNLNLLFIYIPSIIIMTVAAVMSFRLGGEQAGPEENPDSSCVADVQEN